MRSPRRVLLLLLLLLGLAVLFQRSQSRSASIVSAPGRSLGPEHESVWQTENEWLAGEILRDTGETLCAATGRTNGRPAVVRVVPRPRQRTGPPVPGEAFEVDAQVECGDRLQAQRISFRSHVWAPEEYAPWVSALMGVAGLEAGPASSDEILVERLTNPTPEVLADADRRISARLRARLLDAGAHEDAALLLTAFALREAAAAFTDVRALLCRSAAHLALARVLRGDKPTGQAGRLALIGLQILAGRGNDAEGLIAAMEGATLAPNVRSWVAALRMRLRQDWRVESGLSPLGRRERASARAWTVGIEAALADLDEGELDRSADWNRMVFSHPMNVEVAWRFAVDGVERELTEFSRGIGRDLAQMPQAELVALANTPARRLMDPSSGPEVLGVGQWAAAFQRHVASAMVTLDRHWRSQQAAPSAADKASRQLDGRFARLTLHPLMAVRRARDGYKGDATSMRADAVALMRRSPELVTATLWAYLEAADPQQAPSRMAWFSTGFPWGTAHWPEDRFEALPWLYAAPWVAAAHELNPQARYVAFEELSRSGGSYAVARSRVGARLDYDAEFLEHVVDWEPERERGALYERLCEMDPERCIKAGWFFVSQAADARAVWAYQRTFDRARDRVTASNNMRWLVEYYEGHGQPARAEAIAAAGAEIYSGGGLDTQAWLFEKRGRIAEAEHLFEAVHSRYRRSDSLLEFYVRRERAGDMSRVKQRERLVAEIFPGGRKRVSLGDFRDPPARGARISINNERLAAAGLAGGDVAVALDGWLVENAAQYKCVHTLGDAPELVLIVWRRGRGYFEVRASPPKRYFNANFLDYPASH